LFKKILTYAVFTAGLFLLLLGGTLFKLAPLSKSLKSASVLPLLTGAALFLGGLLRGEKPLLKILTGSFFAWLILAVLVFAVQDRLLFKQRRLSESRLAAISEQAAFEELTIEAEDGVRLHGWLLPGEKLPAPLVIVFGGQGTEASRQFKLQDYIPEFTWAFFNYRGYGLSTGVPSEAGFLADALTVYDNLLAHPFVDGKNVFALGGSLGTGVAAYLAAKRPLTAVALFSPYDSIGGGVAQDLLPLLPTKFLIRSPFRAEKWAAQTKAPALAVIGSADRLISPGRSKSLMSRWAQEAVLHFVPGGDHYTIYKDEAAWAAVRRFFLERVN